MKGAVISICLGGKCEPAHGVWEAFISIIPHVLWTVLILIVLLKFGRDSITILMGRVQKLSVAGVEVEFKEVLQTAADARQQAPSAIELGQASRRLMAQIGLLKGARLLWIDDNPDNNRLETELLESAGARIDIQVANDAAESAIERISYDVVLSDIEREGSDTGLKFAEELSKVRNCPSVIFYVSTARKPVPAFAFGITDRPEELMHLILDVLGRKRS